MNATIYAPGLTVALHSTAPLPSTLGTITQYPLPALSGTTYGQNYFGFPFVSNRGSKQSEMFYCPTNDRIYAQGGDTTASATDGTWSVDASLVNDWRLDVGRPVYPTLPAPHALQDSFGARWVPSRNAFFIYPGNYYAYDNGNNPPDPTVYPLLNYSCGCWWLDPTTNKYVQDKRYFKQYLIAPVSTGCPYGGWFDDVNLQFGALNDSQSGSGCSRWDVATMTKLPTLPFTVHPDPAHPTATTAYFTRTKYAQIGRKVYAIGKTTHDGVAWYPGFWCWDMDAHTFTTLAAPPALLVSDLETQLNASNGKVVWLKFDGPDGVIKAIYIYDPAANAWSQDTQPLPAGFMGNVTCSLPDGRIALAGGNFGPQQTHFNFYRLN